MALPIEHISQKDKRLAKIINLVGDLEYGNRNDSFSFIVCEIVGQMISNKVRRVLIARLVDLCSGNITVENISKLSIQDLRSIGLSNAKSSYILNFADMVSKGELDFDELKKCSDEDIIKRLTQIKGIGAWTAKMYLLFNLQRPNVLPLEDGAFLQGFNWLYNKKEKDLDYIKKKAKRWHPYCSLASLYIYECVNRDFIKFNATKFLNELG